MGVNLFNTLPYELRRRIRLESERQRRLPEIPLGEKWPWASYAGMQREFLWGHAAPQVQPPSFEAGSIFEQMVGERLDELGIGGLKSLQYRASHLIGEGPNRVPGTIPDFELELPPEEAEKFGATHVVGEFMLAAGDLKKQPDLYRHVRGQLSMYQMFYQEKGLGRPVLAYHSLPEYVDKIPTENIMQQATQAIVREGKGSPTARAIMQPLVDIMVKDISEGKYSFLDPEDIITPEQAGKERQRVWGELKAGSKVGARVMGRVIPRITEGEGLTEKGWENAGQWLRARGMIESTASIHSLEGRQQAIRAMFELAQEEPEAMERMPGSIGEAIGLVGSKLAMTTAEMIPWWERAVQAGAVEPNGDPGTQYENFLGWIKRTMTPGFEETQSLERRRISAFEQMRAKGIELPVDPEMQVMTLSQWAHAESGWKAVRELQYPEAMEEFRKIYPKDPSKAVQGAEGLQFLSSSPHVVSWHAWGELGYGTAQIGGTDVMVGPPAGGKMIKRLKQQLEGLGEVRAPGWMSKGGFQALPQEESWLRLGPHSRHAITGYRAQMFYTQHEVWGPGVGGLNPFWVNAVAKPMAVQFGVSQGIGKEDFLVKEGDVIGPGSRFTFTEGGREFNTEDYSWQIREFQYTPEMRTYTNAEGLDVSEERPLWTAQVYQVLGLGGERTTMPGATFKGMGGNKSMALSMRPEYWPTDENGQPLAAAGVVAMKPLLATFFSMVAAMPEEEVARKVPGYRPGMTWNDIMLRLFQNNTPENATRIYQDFFAPHEMTMYTKHIVGRDFAKFFVSEMNVVNPTTREPLYVVDAQGRRTPRTNPATGKPYTAEEIMSIVATPVGDMKRYDIMTADVGWNINVIGNMGIDAGASQYTLPWTEASYMRARNPMLVDRAVAASTYSRYAAGQVVAAAGLNKGIVEEPANIAVIDPEAVKRLYNQVDQLARTMAESGTRAGSYEREQALLSTLRAFPQLQNRVLQLQYQSGSEIKSVYAPPIQMMEQQSFQTPSGEEHNRVLQSLSDAIREITGNVRDGVIYRTVDISEQESRQMTGVERIRYYTEQMATRPSNVLQLLGNRVPGAEGRMPGQSWLNANEFVDIDQPVGSTANINRMPSSGPSGNLGNVVYNVGPQATEFQGARVINPYTAWVNNGDMDGDTYYFIYHPGGVVITEDGMMGRVTNGETDWKVKPKALSWMTPGIWIPGEKRWVNGREQTQFVLTSTKQTIHDDVMRAAMRGSGSPIEDTLNAPLSMSVARSGMISEITKWGVYDATQAQIDSSERGINQMQVGIHYNPWYIRLPMAAVSLGKDASPAAIQEAVNASLRIFDTAYTKAQGPGPVKGPVLPANWLAGVMRRYDILSYQYDPQERTGEWVPNSSITIPFTGTKPGELQHEFNLLNDTLTTSTGTQYSVQTQGGVAGLMQFMGLSASLISTFATQKAFEPLSDTFQGMSSRQLLTARDRALLFSPIGKESIIQSMTGVFRDLDAEIFGTPNLPIPITDRMRPISQAAMDNFWQGIQNSLGSISTILDTPIGLAALGPAIARPVVQPVIMEGMQGAWQGLSAVRKAMGNTEPITLGETFSALRQDIGRVLEEQKQGFNLETRVSMKAWYEARALNKEIGTAVVESGTDIAKLLEEAELRAKASALGGGINWTDLKVAKANYEQAALGFETAKVKKGALGEDVERVIAGARFVINDVFPGMGIKAANPLYPEAVESMEADEGLFGDIQPAAPAYFGVAPVEEDVEPIVSSLIDEVMRQIAGQSTAGTYTRNFIPQNWGMVTVPHAYASTITSQLAGMGMHVQYGEYDEEGMMPIFATPGALFQQGVRGRIVETGPWQNDEYYQEEPDWLGMLPLEESPEGYYESW